MKTKFLVSFLLMTIVLVISGCGCRPAAAPKFSLKLEIWGFNDDRDQLNGIFEAYKKLNPNITSIEYKKITYDTYKKELIDALASGQGPDIFLIRNNWLPGFQDKIIPAPAQILGEQKFRTDFVDVVSRDFLETGQIYAVPLSVDSMSLYYNKDLFNQAGITLPPKTWDEFTSDAARLTRLSESNEILQSGVSMGTAYNINRSVDVFNMLMLQQGTNISDKNSGKVTFNRADSSDPSVASSPGERALNFYTQFSRVGSSSYTWNTRSHNSLDAFSEGTVGMMFNYSWQINQIRQKSPKLNFAVAPIPQFPGASPTDYADYWGFAVAKNKTLAAPTGNTANVVPITNDMRVTEAWKFLKFLTTRPEQPINITSNVAGNTQTTATNFDPALEYVNAAHRPSARRDIVEKQKTDPEIGVFATQNLIAKSWYEKDPDVIEGMEAEMINQINLGQITSSEAIRGLAAKIDQMMSN